MAKIDRIDRWLLAPEVNAAGRLGVYRILFVIFTLISVFPVNQYWQIQNMPQELWKPVVPLMWMDAPPSGAFLTALDAVYIASLVLLGLGLRTRLMTFIVLLSGTLMTCVMYSFSKIDHGDTFMRVYIPAVMLFAPWGASYSLDAVLRKRKGIQPPAPTDSSLRYSWPILFLFWILCIMFMVGGIVKAVPPGQWLTQPELLRWFMLEYNIGQEPLYLRYVLAQSSTVATLLMYVALAFETFYPLAAINKDWRRFYISSTIFFHLGTGISLGIATVATMILYVLVFDLWGLYDRFFPKRLRHQLDRLFDSASAPLLIGGALLLTGVIVILHLIQPAIPDRLQVGAIFNTYVWWPAAALAVYGIALSLPKIVVGFVESVRPKRKPQTEAQIAPLSEA